MSKLDDFIDRAGPQAVLMVSLPALAEVRRNGDKTAWVTASGREFYRGALIEEHDEWSWGWMVRKSDGSYVEEYPKTRASTEGTRK